MSPHPARLLAASALCLSACGPRADLTVVSAENMGVLARSDAIQGRDGGPSGLAFGRTVWTYGDTVLNDVDIDGTNWHTNSFDDADPSDWQDGFHTRVDATGAPVFFVELTEEEKAWDKVEGNPRWALWPSQPLMAEGDHRAWVLYGLFNDEHPSGIGVATWSGLDAKVERHRVGDSWLLFPHPETEWANAPVVFEGHLYAFGCDLDGLARPCGLARVPLDAVDQRDAWRFWDGDAWVSDSAAHAVIFDGAPIMSVSWNQALDRWLLIYSNVFSNLITARTAPELTGPWSKEITLFSAGKDTPYDAVHHAEVEEDGGRVQWITYSRHTEGWFGAEHLKWRVELEPRD